jgi:hypothetical protein
MTRSQWAFIFGTWGALVRMSMSSAWKTASKAVEYFMSRSRSRNRSALRSPLISAVRLRACCRPVLGRVGGDARDVESPCAVFKEYQGVEAFAERGVDVEEVRCDDATGLVGQELFPVGPVRRGAGSMPAVFRISHTVDAAILWPRPAGSPWILLWPRGRVSWARSRTSFLIVV